MHNQQCIKELTWKHKYWFSREYNLLSSSIFWNWSLRRDLVMPLVKLKNTSNQFELKSSNFYLTWHRWSTYNTTWIPLNLISFFFFFSFESGGIAHHDQLIFSFYIHSWLPLYPPGGISKCCKWATYIYEYESWKEYESYA